MKCLILHTCKMKARIALQFVGVWPLFVPTNELDKAVVAFVENYQQDLILTKTKSK